MNIDMSFKQVSSFILHTLKPFRLSINVMYIVAIIWAIDLSVRPYVLKMMIDKIGVTEGRDVFTSVGFLALIYFLMNLIPPVLFRIYGYFVEIKMIPSLRRNIANSSFDSLLKQSYTYYQNNFAGSLSNKVSDLTSSIPEIVQIFIDRFFSHFLAIFIAVLILWKVNYVFSLGMFVWSSACVLGSLLVSRRISSLADIWSEQWSATSGKIVDKLSNILSIKLFARDENERESLNSSLGDVAKAERKLQWTYFWVWFCYGFSFVIFQGFSLYILLKGRQSGWITVGDFVVVLSINFAIVDLLWQFTKDFSQFSKLWGKVTQGLRNIQVIPEIQDKPNAPLLKVTDGEIIFDKVQFHYKGSKPLFEDKSLVIKAGEKVGLVGYSGSGKTSFVNLLLRLYDINAGNILIDKQNINDVTQNSLHENIAMIPQDPSLFHKTILDNIRYARIDATDEEVMQASKHAHAHEFIMNLPEGYQALVGERGVKLSGGQRQRIAIARAFLKNAPILIMDEATSQLDSVTEGYIQESLWELMQGKTTLVIAHRLSTLLHMDRILLFNNGKIVGDGSHDALIQTNELYKSLWNAQVGGFLPDHKV